MKRAFIQVPRYLTSLQFKYSSPERKWPVSTAFLGALWAHCAESAPRKAVDSIYTLALRVLALYQPGIKLRQELYSARSGRVTDMARLGKVLTLGIIE